MNHGAAGGVFYAHTDKGMAHTRFDLPDYLSDLNAMHEAEKVLTAVQRAQYIQELERICEYDICFATASQRAEAFIRTLNLWPK